MSYEFATAFFCPGCETDALSRFGQIKRYRCPRCQLEFDEPIVREIPLSRQEQQQSAAPRERRVRRG